VNVKFDTKRKLNNFHTVKTLSFTSFSIPQYVNSRVCFKIQRHYKQSRYKTVERILKTLKNIHLTRYKDVDQQTMTFLRVKENFLSSPSHKRIRLLLASSVASKLLLQFHTNEFTKTPVSKQFCN